MTTIPELAEAMQTLLTTTADEVARKQGFVKRRRKVSGAKFAQTLVFSFLANPASTREEVRQAAATVGMVLSTPGLDKRFTAKAAFFLDTLLQRALEQLVVAVPGVEGLLARFAGVYIADTSRITLPAELALVWPGGNGAADAAVKTAVRWDLNSGQLTLRLQGARVHDQQTGIGSAVLPPGSLRLNDLGFFNLATFAQDLTQGSEFFTRYKHGTTLATPDGTRLDLLRLLNQHGPTTVDRPVLVGAKQLPARLIALPMPQEVAEQRRRRLRAQARRKQQPLSQTTLALAAWTLYLTSLPPEHLTVQEAPILGMTRWQIEVLFRLWKNSGLLDEWRSHDPSRIWCEFYAKLLALLVQHWLIVVSCWHRLNRSLHRAAQLIRKQAFHLASLLPDRPALIRALSHLAHTLALTCGQSKRGDHPLTFQYWLEVEDT
ncbi:MAG: IS4 family transposase [Anaerolineae bacterium]|nr:IS4 family transposase [Anaerolineae bacterium]